MVDAVLRPADALAPADLHALAMAAFADYVIGPFQLTPEQWPGFLRRHGVDLGASRVARWDDRPVAFALAAPRPETGRWRLGMMGALPDARGSGVAAALLEDFIARGTAAGAAALELECIAQNPRALRLYERHGFRVEHELHGWSQPADASRRAPAADDAPPAPYAVDPATAFAWLEDVVRRVPDLPLQVTAPSLAAVARPLTCWRLGSAQLVFSVVESTPTQVHSLVDTDPAQRDAQALLRQLRRTHAADEIAIPPLQRDDLGGDAARREGFAPQAIHQVLMVRSAGN